MPVTRLVPELPALDVMPQPALLAVHDEPPFTLAETLGALNVSGYMTTT